ncbi:MAG: hypothetical protein IKA24_09250 [Mogibacterium sp.]|nr:hypothetical protein [Mogibacterium sp.]
MNKKIVVLCAVLAVVFDLIACIGDSNAAVYSIFMGLCCAAFCAYVYGLFRVGYTRKDFSEIEAKSEDSFRKAA